MMESILDSLTAEKLYPSGCTNLLDLEELSDGDFLTNVPFSGDQMDDFSSELFNSFFDDHLLERPLLADRPSLLHMDIDSSPDIQAEHSYSLSEDSAPQSPALSIKMDQESEFEWSFSQDLSAILVKQEEPDVVQRLDPQPMEGPPLILSPAPPHRGSAWKHTMMLSSSRPPLPAVTTATVTAPCLPPPHTSLCPLLLLNHNRDQEVEPLLPPLPPPPLPQPSPLHLSSLHHIASHMGAIQEINVRKISYTSAAKADAQSLRDAAELVAQRVGSLSTVAELQCSSLMEGLEFWSLPSKKLQGSGPLMLTEEEKRTLVAEGYPVPNKLPLTKSEEKALKRVRRKIKNKISAQESRRKKKEYVECLEKKSLLQQLQKLQSLISGKVVPRSCKMASTQTGTCLMMVALCFVLVLGSFSPCLSPLSFLTHTPSLSASSSSSSSPPLPSADLYTTSQVRSRSLLFYNDGAPLEESSVTEGERLQSEAHSHIQTIRYTADAHSNQTTGPKLDRREKKPDGASEIF
ncbi:hypothetical protein INR49_022079 [Caranx melampygus]|nr:hypothetical protein INR49_022079 [Caranx melampygus]